MMFWWWIGYKLINDQNDYQVHEHIYTSLRVKGNLRFAFVHLIRRSIEIRNIRNLIERCVVYKSLCRRCWWTIDRWMLDRHHNGKSQATLDKKSLSKPILTWSAEAFTHNLMNCDYIHGYRIVVQRTPIWMFKSHLYLKSYHIISGHVK